MLGRLCESINSHDSVEWVWIINLNIFYILKNSHMWRGNLSKGSYHQNLTVCIKSFYCTVPLATTRQSAIESTASNFSGPLSEAPGSRRWRILHAHCLLWHSRLLAAWNHLNFGDSSLPRHCTPDVSWNTYRNIIFNLNTANHGLVLIATLSYSFRLPTTVVYHLSLITSIIHYDG